MTEPRPIVSQKDRIADAYQKWYGALLGYICKRIGWDRTEDAEDLEDFSVDDLSDLNLDDDI